MTAPRPEPNEAVNATPPRRAAPAPAPCAATVELPPQELVSDNLGATDLTALAEIRDYSVSDPNASSGYVTVSYRVRVLEQFA